MTRPEDRERQEDRQRLQAFERALLRFNDVQTEQAKVEQLERAFFHVNDAGFAARHPQVVASFTGEVEKLAEAWSALAIPELVRLLEQARALCLAARDERPGLLQ